MGALKQLLRWLLLRIETAFGAVFGPRLNPVVQLGALGWFLFWIVAATGVYLFVFFDTGVVNAYGSVQWITESQWFHAGIARSLHRYASDLMIAVMLVHLVREWSLGRHRGARWFSWLTGVPVLWLVYVSAAPNMPVLGRVPGTEVFLSVADVPKCRTYPGLLVLGFDAGLFFVDSDALNDRLRGLAQQADPPYRVVVLDFEGVNYIDSQGSQALGEIEAAISSHGAQLRLARVKPAVLRVLHADGVLQRVGRHNIHGTVYAAAQDILPAEAPTPKNANEH